MKKKCDNCSAELAKFTFFNADKKIYRHNSAMLCLECYQKISNREQLPEA